jgi:hypothetical protein
MNKSTVLNDFMKELVGNIRYDVRLVMSDDNARTHDLRRDVRPLSSASSHSSSSRNMVVCSDNASPRLPKRMVSVPLMNDCCAAPLPPTRKRSVDVIPSSPSSPPSHPSDPPTRSDTPNKPALVLKRASSDNGTVLKRSSSDNGTSPKASNKISNVGVSRWQDDAMFSSDSQLFSAPPRAPASENSPMFVMARKRKGSSNRKSAAVVSPPRVSQGKQFSPSKSPSSWCSSANNHRHLADMSSILSSSSSQDTDMSPVEALEEALDVVGGQEQQQQMWVEA